MTAAICSERVTDHVEIITIDRPPVNALDRAAQRALTEALGRAHDDLDVRCVVLHGRNGAFCAGADLREEQSIERSEVGALLTDVGAMLDAVAEHRVPVVASVDGPAHGGGLELALSCAIRVVSPRASFAAAGVRVGLVANVRQLSRAVGPARARHLLLTGDTCDAARALDWGLATEMADEPLAAAIAIAERIARRAPLSVEATKAMCDRDPELDEAEARTLQVREFARLFRTRDHAEALTAFFERRAGSYERR